jgi:hypothetical protein
MGNHHGFARPWLVKLLDTECIWHVVELVITSYYILLQYIPVISQEYFGFTPMVQASNPIQSGAPKR